MIFNERRKFVPAGYFLKWLMSGLLMLFALGNSAWASEFPKMVKLVSVSSSETNQITVDWFPSEDDQTSHQDMLYQVHISPNKNFVPDSSTMRYQAKGIITATITDLLADFNYAVMVTATDEDGNESWSNKLSVKTIALPTIRTHQKIWTPTSITGQTLRSTKVGDNNEIILPADEPVPEQGEYLVSEQGGGYLKRVVSVTQKDGQTHVQMEQAALTDIFESVEFSTVIKMEDIPPETQNQSNLRRKSTGNQHQVTWPESGLTLSKIDTPELRKVPAIESMAPSDYTDRTRRLDISGDTQTNTGSYAIFSGPAFIGAKPDELLLFKLNLETTRKDVMVCGIKMTDFYHKDKTKNELPEPQIGKFLPSNYEQNGVITVSWNVTKSHVHDGGLPYYATFTAYTDDVDEGCNGDGFVGTWADVLELEIPIYVTMGELPDHEQRSLKFSKGFEVRDTVTIDFKPTIEVGAKIKRASLQEANIIASADLGFRNQLHIAAMGQATLDMTKTLLRPRSFVKIFAVGGVPIVIRGEFGIDLHVVGTAKGEITLDLDKYFGFPEAHFGLYYVKGKGWQAIKDFSPKYNFEIKGEGNAGVDLELTLIPDLTLSFYDAASGRILVEPYLYSNAGIHGHLRYQNNNDGALTDADYWFTNLEAGGGLNMRLYAGLHIFDYNIASYPKDVELNQKDKFAFFKVIGRKPFAKLPTLTATYDETLPLDNSRSVLLTGNYENVSNPFFSWFGPESFFAFKEWIEPKIITNKTGAKIIPLNESPSGRYWFTYNEPGDYTIRLGGYSILGPLVRQVANEINLSLPDKDGDGMVDYWEHLYGVEDPLGDPDQDGINNLHEFQEGKFPKVSDSSQVGIVAEATCQLYAVHDQKRSDSQLLTVSEVEVVDEVGNPVTGTTDNLTFNYQINTLGPLYEGHDIEAIAVHPVTNRVYVVSGKDVAKDQPRGYLYAVDGQDGELFLIGSTGFKEIEDLAFGNDGTLWAWAKGDGMITIDLATGTGTLVIPSKVKIEGLTLSKNTDHTVFYGSVGKALWDYNLTTNQLNVACDNFPGEVEALEMLPDGTLLIGIHENKGFSLQAFDVDNCQVIPDFSIPTGSFDDVEGIAFPVEACAK